MQWIVLALTVLMYALIILFPNIKAYITLGTAIIMMLLRVVGFQEAIITMVNWNILMIFVGSLVIAELFIYSRMPARIADEIIDRSPNVGIAIVAILMMTGIISAFVENVATVLVMAPIALALSKKLKMDPTYFMVGLAVMANLQGTATLVGDPPSMIFADFAKYGFNDFFVYQGKPSIFFAVQIGMLAGALFFYGYFKKAGTGKVDIEREEIKSYFPTILLILMITGLALASWLHSGVSLTAGLIVVALALIGIIWYRLVRHESREVTLQMVKELDWDTVLFLIGIFIVVGAVTKAGLLEAFAGFLQGYIGSNILLGFIVIIAVSILISGFVDNVPYIVVMLPVSKALASGLSLKPELYMFALLIGSCMGGNLTPFGASANVVSVGILKKQGYPMYFKDWLKIGLPYTLLTTGVASLFIWFVWK
ncbi:SLC13 family permease [Gracilinema caldarium]|uniref:Citrate transporter n=1 Tax=Gracilinema caldarium (strain ATCC 51460 / DSM 7334 / H1) TaxID=744872 RepID=F8F0Y2_GRAC1|nr:SLC13 family permease [Gracilinema caldarium]AEJ20268.1 Citrate transporter [Gracilinema caldarium DSM 7334]